MNRPQNGETVSWFDDWRQERKSGILVEMRRSSRHPWQVAVVRLPDETTVEIYPDRLVLTKAHK